MQFEVFQGSTQAYSAQVKPAGFYKLTGIFSKSSAI
jgi:hypothetical protein